jgi:hypothetical protein
VVSSKTKVGSMAKVSAYHHRVAEAKRLRPVADAAFLDAVARHLADAARLPLRVAKARVQQLSVSATSKPAPGRPPSDER